MYREVEGMWKKNDRLFLISFMNHEAAYHHCHRQGRAFLPAVQPQQSLTFQHFHSNSERLVGLLLVDADSLGHHHLTEATLAQRFTQSQPGNKKQDSLRALNFSASTVDGCS